MTSFLNGILFDFDGTLADTMEEHYLAWQSALSKHGISIEEKDYYPLEGRKLHEVARTFARGPTWSSEAIDDLVREKKENYVSRGSITFFPGVELLISELSDLRIPMGIVTAGHLDQLELSVPKNFLGQFDVLITGERLSKGKPHPEPYLQGARALGLQPAECIAIENAPIGVQSAKRANIYCVGICSTVDRDHLVEADEVLDCFDDLRNSTKFKQFLKPKLP